MSPSQTISEQEIIHIIAKLIDVEPSQINCDTAIGDFPTWDSLAQLSIMTSLEENYACSFEESDMLEAETVSDITKLVNSKVSHAPHQ